MDVHGQLDLQAGGGLHLFLQNGGGPLRLGGGCLHDELVVHLKDQAGLQPLGGQPVRHPDHGEFDDIGRGALDGHVAGHPLTEGTGDPVGGFQLRQGPAAVEQGLGAAGFLRPLDEGVHEARHGGIMMEVPLDIGLGLAVGDADVLGEGVGADAVHDAEIDRLGPGAHEGGDQLLRHPKHLGGGDAVNVHVGVEGLDHRGISRHVGQHPQFDLRIVRVHQHPAIRRAEKAAQFPAQLLPDGNVLEIGLGGGNAAGAGFGLVEGGVDPAVRPNDL